MKAKRRIAPWLACLSAAALLTGGCSSVQHPKSTVPKPGRAAAAANDFPSAIQAGIPASTIQK